MTGSPWMSVLIIAGVFGGGLLFLMLILKSEGLRKALNGAFGLPLLIAMLVGGFGASVLTALNGTGDTPGFAMLIAVNMMTGAELLKWRWARVLLWLDGVVLAAVTAGVWVSERDFAADALWIRAAAVIFAGFLLWIAVSSLLRLFRPPITTAAETGTPA